MKNRWSRIAVVGVIVGCVCAAAGFVLGMYAAIDENIGFGAASGFLCILAVPCFVTAVVAAVVAGRSARRQTGFDVIVKDGRR